MLAPAACSAAKRCVVLWMHFGFEGRPESGGAGRASGDAGANRAPAAFGTTCVSECASSARGRACVFCISGSRSAMVYMYGADESGRVLETAPDRDRTAASGEREAV